MLDGLVPLAPVSQEQRSGPAVKCCEPVLIELEEVLNYSDINLLLSNRQRSES